MPESAAPRRRIGFALLVSAAVFVGAAIAVGAGLLPVPPDVQWIVMIAFCGTALVDALLALKFLLSSSK